MNIEIRDSALEARIQRQLQATGAASVEEVLLRLLETQEEQDRWLAENREMINPHSSKTYGGTMLHASKVLIYQRLSRKITTRTDPKFIPTH